MKVCLVSAAEDPYWQSCRAITNGLRLAYQRLGSGFEVIEHRISVRASDKAVGEAARKILDDAPDTIAFLDTWPFYGQLLSELARAYSKKRSRPFLRFHAYGDFTLKSGQWLSWERSIAVFRAEWACASEAQRGLVATLAGSGAGAWICPFPVDLDAFSPSRSQRSETRKALGVASSETLVLYTGRLSLQKNVIAAARAFSLTSPEFQKRAWFYFVGDFDDFNAPFADAPFRRGGFHERWQAELKSLPPATRQRIRFVSGMPNLELSRMYNAADVFCSLSLVHDEDFGMAPAEAAACGLPLVLTGWGGYLGFRDLKLGGAWIPVTLESSGPAFDLAQVARALEEHAKPSQSDRLRQARCAERGLSVRAVARLIRERTRDSSRLCRFEGFSPMMKELSSYFDPVSKALIYPDAPHGVAKGSVYEAIYQNYVSP